MFFICFVAINWLSFFREFYSIFWVFSSSVFWLGILFCHFCCQYKKKSFLQFICIYFVYLHFLCGSTSGKKIKKNHLFIFIYLLLCCYYLLHLFFLWASLDLGNYINRAAIFLSKQIFLFFLLYSGVMSFNWVVTLRFETKFDTFILHTNPCFGAQTFDFGQTFQGDSIQWYNPYFAGGWKSFNESSTVQWFALHIVHFVYWMEGIMIAQYVNSWAKICTFQSLYRQFSLEVY